MHLSLKFSLSEFEMFTLASKSLVSLASLVVGGALTFLLHRDSHAACPLSSNAVWIEAGLAGLVPTFDLQRRINVCYIGLEPTPSAASRSAARLIGNGIPASRFTVLQRACTRSPTPLTLTLNVHANSFCNTLFVPTPVHRAVGKHGDCIGGPTSELSVPTITLAEVMRRLVPHPLRVQLLKLDIRKHAVRTHTQITPTHILMPPLYSWRREPSRLSRLRQLHAGLMGGTTPSRSLHTAPPPHRYPIALQQHGIAVTVCA